MDDIKKRIQIKSLLDDFQADRKYPLFFDDYYKLDKTGDKKNCGEQSKVFHEIE